MKILGKIFCIFLIVVSVTSTVFANSDEVYIQTAKFLAGTVDAPVSASVGGEWAVIALVCGGEADQNYGEIYYSNLKKTVTEKNGVLHIRKYTEYSRAAMAIRAVGKNPENVAGYNLMEPLCDFDAVTKQGVNGAVFALIAIRSGEAGKYDEFAEKYEEYILSKQNPDGGFSLGDGASETDVTAMAVQALTLTDGNSEAVEKALEYLSAVQSENGGFCLHGEENAESCAQVIIALCGAGVEITDSRFVKNGKNPLDNLLTFYNGEGFSHITGSGTNLMATEQALCALTALKKAKNQEPFLYKFVFAEKQENKNEERNEESEDYKRIEAVAAKCEKCLPEGKTKVFLNEILAWLRREKI